MFVFFFNDTATTEIYTLSLHDALPICSWIDKSEINDIHRGKSKTRKHAGDRTLSVHPLIEDSHYDSWEEGRRGQAKGKCHHLSNIGRGVNTEIAGD